MSSPVLETEEKLWGRRGGGTGGMCGSDLPSSSCGRTLRLSQVKEEEEEGTDVLTLILILLVDTFKC